MAALNSVAAHNPNLRSFVRPTIEEPTGRFSSFCRLSPSTELRRNWRVGSVTEDRKVVSVEKSFSKDSKTPLPVNGPDDFENSNFEAKEEGDEVEMPVSRAINAAIVLGMGTLAVTKLLTIDHDYWQVNKHFSIFNTCLQFLFGEGIDINKIPATKGFVEFVLSKFKFRT